MSRLSQQPGNVNAHRVAAACSLAAVDATPARRRLHALMRIGWTMEDLAVRTGIARGTLQNATGKWTTTPRVVDAVVGVYADLSMIPGPSDRTRRHAARQDWAPPLAWDDEPLAVQAVRFTPTLLGLLPTLTVALAPHYIDNPDATPTGVASEHDNAPEPEADWYDEVVVMRACKGQSPRPLTETERVETLRRMRQQGTTKEAILRALRCGDSVYKRLADRADRSERAA